MWAVARRPALERIAIPVLFQNSSQVILGNVESRVERVERAFGLGRIAALAGQHWEQCAALRMTWRMAICLLLASAQRPLVISQSWLCQRAGPYGLVHRPEFSTSGVTWY